MIDDWWLMRRQAHGLDAHRQRPWPPQSPVPLFPAPFLWIFVRPCLAKQCKACITISKHGEPPLGERKYNISHDHAWYEFTWSSAGSARGSRSLEENQGQGQAHDEGRSNSNIITAMTKRLGLAARKKLEIVKRSRRAAQLQYELSVENALRNTNIKVKTKWLWMCRERYLFFT